MNYLAHIYLSGENPEMKIGGLLGDFIKGPLTPEQHAPFYSGILLHRRLDSYVDKLPALTRALSDMPSVHRRFGGIILDILFDHFLANQWSDRHHQSLDGYCQAFYRQLNHHYDELPPGAQHFAQLAPQVNWLQNYQDFDNLSPILMRVGQRFKKPVALEGSVTYIETAYDSLYQTYLEIFPLLEQFAEQQRISILPVTP